MSKLVPSPINRHPIGRLLIPAHGFVLIVRRSRVGVKSQYLFFPVLSDSGRAASDRVIGRCAALVHVHMYTCSLVRTFFAFNERFLHSGSRPRAPALDRDRHPTENLSARNGLTDVEGRPKYLVGAAARNAAISQHTENRVRQRNGESKGKLVINSSARDR